MASVEPDPGMAAWRAFLEAHARVVELLENELLETKQLPLAWYDVLVQLHEADGHQLRMTELAKRVLLSKSGLTRLVDRMCAAGLVDRKPDEEDRRGRWVALNVAGEQRLRDAAPIHLRGVREHFIAHLDNATAAVVGTALRTIAEAAETRRG